MRKIIFLLLISVLTVNALAQEKNIGVDGWEYSANIINVNCDQNSLVHFSVFITEGDYNIVGGQATDVIFDFGDGNSQTVPLIYDASSFIYLAEVNYTYSSTGSYNTTATVIDAASSTVITLNLTVDYFPLSYYLLGGNLDAVQSGNSYTFTYNGTLVIPPPGYIVSYIMDYGDASQETGGWLTNGQVFGPHIYNTPFYGTAVLTVIFESPEGDGCSESYLATITTDSSDCCTNFTPIQEGRYWLSAWVKEDQLQQVKEYLNSYIKLSFSGGIGGTFDFHPSGDIVEGWQRIVGDFIVPAGATSMDIKLMNDNLSVDAYFDDIRIHPFNSSMKSYVYDPETLWLTAELDDNNYATFYEYDKEGRLIRIKKETARGIMTIQESRSSNRKVN